MRQLVRRILADLLGTTVAEAEEVVEVSTLTLADSEVDGGYAGAVVRGERVLHLWRGSWESSQGIDMSAMRRSVRIIGPNSQLGFSYSKSSKFVLSFTIMMAVSCLGRRKEVTCKSN